MSHTNPYGTGPFPTPAYAQYPTQQGFDTNQPNPQYPAQQPQQNFHQHQHPVQQAHQNFHHYHHHAQQVYNQPNPQFLLANVAPAQAPVGQNQPPYNPNGRTNSSSFTARVTYTFTPPNASSSAPLPGRQGLSASHSGSTRGLHSRVTVQGPNDPQLSHESQVKPRASSLPATSPRPSGPYAQPQQNYNVYERRTAPTNNPLVFRHPNASPTTANATTTTLTHVPSHQPMDISDASPTPPRPTLPSIQSLLAAAPVQQITTGVHLQLPVIDPIILDKPLSQNLLQLVKNAQRFVSSQSMQMTLTAVGEQVSQVHRALETHPLIDPQLRMDLLSILQLHAAYLLLPIQNNSLNFQSPQDPQTLQIAWGFIQKSKTNLDKMIVANNTNSNSLQESFSHPQYDNQGNFVEMQSFRNIKFSWALRHSLCDLLGSFYFLKLSQHTASKVDVLKAQDFLYKSENVTCPYLRVCSKPILESLALLDNFKSALRLEIARSMPGVQNPAASSTSSQTTTTTTNNS